MSRRLPIYFLIDVSESMAGDELYRLEEALRGVMATLRKDPHCLDTVWVEFLAFAGKADVLSPFTEITAARVPELPIGGGTALGAGLELLMARISANCQENDEIHKGDWKPLVFLLTDGQPTDDYQSAVERWNSSFRAKSTMVAISMSASGDNALLKQLTENVVAYFDTVPEALHSFVAWISQSIVSASRQLGADELNDRVAPADGDHVVNIDQITTDHPDDRFAIVIGRCESTKYPYLIKYERADELIRSLDLPTAHANARFILKSAVALKESYFDWSSEGKSMLIDASQILGQPNCPHCGNPYSVAVDGACGGVHCVSGEGMHICPWCDNPGEYGSSEDGGSSLNIQRGLG